MQDALACNKRVVPCGVALGDVHNAVVHGGNVVQGEHSVVLNSDCLHDNAVLDCDDNV